jgi:hypothetical protein
VGTLAPEDFLLERDQLPLDERADPVAHFPFFGAE